MQDRRNSAIIGNMGTILSVIATITSSIALIGVAVGLILQARQLRADQLQTMRALQLELIRMAIDKPELGLDSFLAKDVDRKDSSRVYYLNLWVKYLEMNYSFGTASKASIGLQMARMFESEFPRIWWTVSRDTYKVEAETKSQREFFTIVDGEFQSAMRAFKSSNGSAEV